MHQRLLAGDLDEQEAIGLVGFNGGLHRVQDFADRHIVALEGEADEVVGVGLD